MPLIFVDEYMFLWYSVDYWYIMEIQSKKIEYFRKEVKMKMARPFVFPDPDDISKNNPAVIVTSIRNCKRLVC